MFVTSKPQQRPHRKSRLGCKICKARKIKCDEVRPICGNCTRRYPDASLHCEFEDLSLPAPRAAPSPSVSAFSNSSFTTVDPSTRSMERRLFHHYSTVTCVIMPMWEEPAAMNMWAVAIPSIAFDCEYVYSAVLGIAALHMLSINPGDVVLRAAAYRYIDETIRGQKEELEGLDGRSSIQLFTAAILLTMCAKLRAKCSGGETEVYELPLNYFHLQIGGRDMWDWMKDDLVETGVGHFVQCMAIKDVLPPTPPLRDGEPRLDFPYDAFLDTWYLDSLLSEEKRGILAGAIECLVRIKESIRKGEQMHLVHRRHSIIPSEVPEGFLALLEQKDQLAIIILARLYAVLKVLEFEDQPWWLVGMAEYEVRGLVGMVSEEWRWAVEWPLAVLEMRREVPPSFP